MITHCWKRKIKYIFIFLMICLFVLSAPGLESEGLCSEAQSLYETINAQYPQFVEDLKARGASEAQIRAWAEAMYTAVYTALVADPQLTPAKLDEKLKNAIINAVFNLNEAHQTVVNAIYNAYGSNPQKLQPVWEIIKTSLTDKIRQDITGAVTGTPAAGMYYKPLQVTLLAGVPTACIYYTTDESDPRTSATRKLYSAPIPVTIHTTINAVAANQGFSSDLFVFDYQIVTPDATKIIVRMQPPGMVDTVSGSAACVPAGALVEVYGRDIPGDLLGSVTAGPDGSFPEIAIGDNAYSKVYVMATGEAGSSDPIAVQNDVVAPQLISFTVAPESNISYNRPTTLSGRADENVSWIVEIFGPGAPGRKYKTFETQGITFSDCWAPSDAYKPSGNYTVRVTIRDAAGNNEQQNYTMEVYNYPIKIVDIKAMDLDGNEKNKFVPSQFYQVEVTFENLGPAREEPLAIIQTVKYLAGGAKLPCSLGTAKIALDIGNTVTLSVGAQAPVEAGTYTAETFIWNRWPSTATIEHPHQTLSEKKTVTIEVISS